MLWVGLLTKPPAERVWVGRVGRPAHNREGRETRPQPGGSGDPPTTGRVGRPAHNREGRETRPQPGHNVGRVGLPMLWVGLLTKPPAERVWVGRVGRPAHNRASVGGSGRVGRPAHNRDTMWVGRVGTSARNRVANPPADPPASCRLLTQPPPGNRVQPRHPVAGAPPRTGEVAGFLARIPGARRTGERRVVNRTRRRSADGRATCRTGCRPPS